MWIWLNFGQDPDYEPFIDYSNLGEFINFDNLDFNFANIVKALRALSDFLGKYESFGFLSSELPILGVSVNDMLGFADKLASALDQLERNPVGSIQVLDAKLKDVLGLPADSKLIQLSLFADDKDTETRATISICSEWTLTSVRLSAGPSMPASI